MKFILYIVICCSLFVGCSNPEPGLREPQAPGKTNRNDYYKNGNIRIERKAIAEGDTVWIFRNEDGSCWEENFYRDDEIYKKIVYNSDCSKSAEYELKNGVRHGKWISYHENGKLREKGQYKDGMSIGIFEYYDEEEKLVSREQNFILDSTLIPFWPFPNTFKTL